MKFRRTPAVLFFIIILIAALLAACASQRAAPTLAPSAGEGARAPSVDNNVTAPSAAEPGQPSQSAQPDRLVVKTGNLTIVVVDPSQSMDAIRKLADDLGGFVVTANLTHNTLENGIEVPRASITIRIPAEKFDEALQRIRAQSDRLPTSEVINSEDVTGQYVDLQSRLRNLEAAEAQLTKIMDSATKTEDVLAVYNQLVQTREQIEVIKGQMQYYEQSAAMSAISVDLVANQAVQPLSIGGWQPVGVVKRAVQALISTMQVLVNAVIWIVLWLLPILLAIGVVFVLPVVLIILGLRAWRRRRRERAKEIVPTETPQS
jgi:curli biogenesis system outer membrane secretion channel CsgG